jgi:hypothetical protein
VISDNTRYRNAGWISWGDWLGTGFIANSKKEFRPLNWFSKDVF